MVFFFKSSRPLLVVGFSHDCQVEAKKSRGTHFHFHGLIDIELEFFRNPILALAGQLKVKRKCLLISMFVFFSFFLHGALKLEGFQRIRDFNAREVIMLVVQVKCKNGSGCMFLRSLFLQKKEIMINSNYYYLWSSNFKISQKCIHFQSLLSSTSLLTSSTECIKRNFRFLWSMTRHTFWTS